MEICVLMKMKIIINTSLDIDIDIDTNINTSINTYLILVRV